MFCSWNNMSKNMSNNLIGTIIPQARRISKIVTVMADEKLQGQLHRHLKYPTVGEIITKIYKAPCNMIFNPVIKIDNK